MVVILMGVSGSGKTTVGIALAHALGWGFFDADDFHSPANVAKMRAGHPLDAQDREPWLRVLAGLISHLLAQGEDAVLACSALTERARRVLIEETDPARVKLVHLTGSPELLRSRLAHRVGHFMPEDLLGSQLATLQTPKGALQVDVAGTPEEIVATIREGLGL
ncbi:gluconokinase [Aggregicoccus sp. 17bor-14]|uniref:gluconokinase n=1 Tax=Myxococcaceae TaxID=31 RepID=UPI00129CB2DE|nr:MULTISPECIES: gluconokinase [Myxococcaceae]MBF5043520.1 gluconokinase [Simulacricoccus sp. 17bor-14]MRI89277.1 gluconokinase [Aggregicoccus sp. 17bor-14]